MDQVKGCIWSMWRRTSSPGASKKLPAVRLEALTPGAVMVLPSKTTWALSFESSTAMVASFCANNAAVNGDCGAAWD